MFALIPIPKPCIYLCLIKTNVASCVCVKAKPLMATSALYTDVLSEILVGSKFKIVLVDLCKTGVAGCLLWQQ